MTNNDELLKKSKEEVAKKYGYENFEDMYSDMIHIGDEDNLLKEIESASIMAINIAREESFKEGYLWCASQPYWQATNENHAYTEYSTKVTPPSN